MKGIWLTTRRAFICICFSFSILVLCDITAAAQAQRQVTAVERREQTMNAQTKQYELDSMGREAKPKTADLKRSREIKNEIAEDLNALQTAYNDIVIALQSSAEPDEKFLAESAAAVKKRAVRLQTNLVLPDRAELDSKPSAVRLPDSRKKILRLLGKHVYDFITNPIFESTSGLDVKLAAKARSALDTIIEFTDRLPAN